jgi:hypothetical protein
VENHLPRKMSPRSLHSRLFIKISQLCQFGGCLEWHSD